jgi:hypothetical protein
MRILRTALPFLLLTAGAAAQPVSEAEARRVLATPLAQTLGAAEAHRIQAMAVVNGLLRHCRLRWEGYFGRMTSQQREELGRSQAEMQRIAVWHGYWLGGAERAADRERAECTRDFQTNLRDRAEALLRAAPARR